MVPFVPPRTLQGPPCASGPGRDRAPDPTVSGQKPIEGVQAAGPVQQPRPRSATRALTPGRGARVAGTESLGARRRREAPERREHPPTRVGTASEPRAFERPKLGRSQARGDACGSLRAERTSPGCAPLPSRPPAPDPGGRQFPGRAGRVRLQTCEKLQHGGRCFNGGAAETRGSRWGTR